MRLSVTSFSRDWLTSFFLIFGIKMQNGNAQNVTEPDFLKKIFPAEKAGNMLEIAVYADFDHTFSLNFLILHKRYL